jgi:DNA replication protein DnaC
MTCSCVGRSPARPHKRYKRRASVLITTNRIIEDWHLCLGDTALTTAILDRLMHRSVLVKFQGRSYRLKEAAARLVNATSAA